MKISKDEMQFVFVGCVSDTNYYLMNVINAIPCWNIEKSTLIAWYGDRAMGLTHASLETDMIGDGVAIFKASPLYNVIFVTQFFFDCVVQNRLTGIGFEDHRDMGGFFPNFITGGGPIL